MLYQENKNIDLWTIKMRCIILVCFTFILFNTANAGFHSFTMHSRANCANNDMQPEAGIEMVGLALKKSLLMQN